MVSLQQCQLFATRSPTRVTGEFFPAIFPAKSATFLLYGLQRGLLRDVLFLKRTVFSLEAKAGIFVAKNDVLQQNRDFRIFLGHVARGGAGR